MRHVLLLTALITVGGCKRVGPCKSNTLFLSLTFDGATRAADQLVVSVAVDNGMPHLNPPKARTPGRTSDSLEIDFSSYPLGRTVTVDVVALQAGAQLGEQSDSVLISAGCASMSLNLGTMSANMPGDLAGSDIAGSDMVCVPAGAEDCFNGIDDDCNGLVDCADPACTSVATCVPAVAGASYGTMLSGSPLPSCPQANATPQPLYGDFVEGTCSVSKCSSASVSGTPSLSVFDDGCGTLLVNASSGCTTQVTPPSTTVGFKAGGLSCSTPTGNPYTSGTFTTDEFCVSATGGGCGADSVCAPKVGSSKSCVMVAATTNCSATPYTNAISPMSGSWYTSKVTTETCSCFAQPAVVGCVCASSLSSCGGCECSAFVTGFCQPFSQAAGTYFVGIEPNSLYCDIEVQRGGTFAGAGEQNNVCCM